jgi:hypothetical protein
MGVLAPDALGSIPRALGRPEFVLGTVGFIKKLPHEAAQEALLARYPEAVLLSAHRPEDVGQLRVRGLPGAIARLTQAFGA